MIRLLIFVVLLCGNAIVLAEPLYKWVEADGSITFSVKPPPAGIKYETVSGSKPQKNETLKAATAAQAQMAPTAQEAVPEGSAPPPAAQRIAPQLGAQVISQEGIRRTTSPQTATNKLPDSLGAVAGSAVSASNALQNDPQHVAAMAIKSRKQRQCEDLKKRVVSLEGRLRNRLTPEDMDNTVIHMARYQRSYDQHCVQ